jgi:uncharacterized protein YdaU (DUF1376 family)
VADLHYFPFYVNDWLGGEATSQMTPAQEGAFIRLLAISWQSKTAPCTLPDDDTALAQMSRLGPQWKKLGPFIKQQFELINGRLRNRKLWLVYQESLDKHQRRVNAGRLGAEAKHQRGRSDAIAVDKQSGSIASGNASSNATPLHVANRKQPESESDTETTTSSSLACDIGDVLAAAVPAAYHPDLVDLLSRVPNATAWTAEMAVALEGMHGPAVTGEQLGQAVRDYNANGEEPSLRLFRGYVRDTTKPRPPASNGRKPHTRNVFDQTYANAQAAMAMIPDPLEN